MEELEAYDFDANVVAGYNFADIQIVPGLPAIILAGVDEVGRGPLAGPVVAAAVILPSSPRLIGLRDSKIVPPEQREALFCEIEETALAFEIAIIEPELIDSLNILGASLLAMRQCLQALNPKPHLVIVDGNQKPKSGLLEHTIVGGDGLSAAIAAASIMAKVTRDHIMTELHEIYPHYGFDEHKGYGAPKHLEALQKYGPCPIHRRSFEPVKSFK